MDKLSHHESSFEQRHAFLKLMPFQWNPFNGDTFLENEILALKDFHKIEKAIELGTCLGSSTLWLSQNFRRVDTTEINREFYVIATERFAEQAGNNITIYNEDSRSILEMLIQSGQQPVFIFIDSHWGQSNPLLQELDIIAQSGNKNVILAIHDFKVPDHPELGWDEYAAEGIVYEWSWIESRIEKIYGKGNFNHYYNSEATGAKRGVVFIEPKK